MLELKGFIKYLLMSAAAGVVFGFSAVTTLVAVWQFYAKG